jgi:tetratricopeptide (TPR) repeat protein
VPVAETRLEQLIKFYQEDPTDAFNVYGLALEYLKSDVQKSEALFDNLLTHIPDYLPTYFQAANLKAELGKHADALRIYKKGIALARRLNDRKALMELQSAHDELLFELE